MTTGKTIVLTKRTFADKVMSLLFNMLSRLVITFLPRSMCLLISWLQSPSAVILEPRKMKSATVSNVSSSICLIMAGNLENAAVATGLEKVSFHSNPKERQAGIKIAGRNINNLRYADDTTLMVESEEELKSLLMKVKVESEKVGLKLNIQRKQRS